MAVQAPGGALAPGQCYCLLVQHAKPELELPMVRECHSKLLFQNGG